MIFLVVLAAVAFVIALYGTWKTDLTAIGFAVIVLATIQLLVRTGVIRS